MMKFISTSSSSSTYFNYWMRCRSTSSMASSGFLRCSEGIWCTTTTTTTTSSTRSRYLSSSVPSTKRSSTPNTVSSYVAATTAVQNRIRSEYNRAMRETRKRYAEEVAELRAREEEERKRTEERRSREKRERDRVKVDRAIANARRQIQMREERMEQWEEELRQTQIRREARKERFHRARLLIIQELEEEAKHWVATTPEEVEHIFGQQEHLTSQKLWARPHSRIGVAPEDATFWRFQADTWTMSKTYPTPKEFIFRQLQETMDYQSNLDEHTYWTPDKVLEQIQKEDRARLRALVQRQTLLHLVQLQLQRESLGTTTTSSTSNSTTSSYNPRKLVVAQVQSHQPLQYGNRKYKSVPPDHPLRYVLAKEQQYPISYADMERQVALSKENFHKFFSPQEDEDLGGQQFQVRPHESWPVLLGKEEPPDKRIEKERNRDKKEEQTLWAQMGGMEGADAEEDDASEEDQEYLSAAAVSDDEEEGDDGSVDEEDLVQDPILRDISQGPDEYKLNEQDVDWMIAKLEEQVMLLEEDIQSQMKSEASEDATTPNTLSSSTTLPRLNEKDTNYIQAMKIIEGLTNEQKQAICALDVVDFKGESEDVPKLMELLSTIPGLSEDQIQAIVDVEMEHSKSIKNAGGGTR